MQVSSNSVKYRGQKFLFHDLLFVAWHACRARNPTVLGFFFICKTYSNDFSAETELFSLIDESYDINSIITTDLPNMVLPNAMFFNGISILPDDTSSCQETQIGMYIKIECKIRR